MVLELRDTPRGRVTDLCEVAPIEIYASTVVRPFLDFVVQNKQLKEKESKDSLHSGDHRRGTAHQNLVTLTMISGAYTGRRHSFLNHLLGDETNTTSPALRRVVENVLIEEWRLIRFNL